MARRAEPAGTAAVRPAPAPIEAGVEGGSSSGHRTSRLLYAWGTSFVSKVSTLLTEVLALPIVYRALGPEAFAAYAGVTSVVAILGFLNLGIGGAVVTPLAHAAASGERREEARVLKCALLPVLATATIGGLVCLPLVAALPVSALFGSAASAAAERGLRISALVAFAGTVIAIPFSVLDNVRQAYQELHINNLIGALSNGLLCGTLLLVSFLWPTLPALVAVMTLAPLSGRLLNAVLLVRARPYLLSPGGSPSSSYDAGLIRDGLRYLAAASSHVLLYQWSVYLMARVGPPVEASRYAVCLRLVLLGFSFFAGITLPVWGATADAVAVRDHQWLRKAVQRARGGALAYGIGALLTLGLFANAILRLWLQRPLEVEARIGWLCGGYLVLATWEYAHFILALGLGALKRASYAVFLRAVLFAVVAPWLAPHGSAAMLLGLCASATLTAWICARLVTGRLATACSNGSCPA